MNWLTVVPDTGCRISIPGLMSSFHDQIFSEIDAARKMAADFATRHGRTPGRLPRIPSGAARLAQEEAAAAEIAALAEEENRLAAQARERAELRAKARAEEHAKAEETREISPAPEQAEFRWNAMTILQGLSKLRAKERSAAEELIRKAHEARVENPPGVVDQEPKGREHGPARPAAPIRGMWAPSLGDSQVWYFTSSGTRCGPVTFDELRTMAVSRVLDPRLDMVWKEGMEEWKQAGLLDGLFERRTVPVATPDKREGKKPGTVAALPKDLTAALASKLMDWPGVGRRPLWIGILAFPVLWNLLLGWSKPTLVAMFGSALMSKLLPYATFVPVAVLIYLILMRLSNLGMSRWWSLMLAIPLLNLWVGFRCLACPPGYACHRKMDRPGMVGTLGIVVLVPAFWYLNLKLPGLLSPAQLQTTVNRLIEGAGKMISPR